MELLMRDRDDDYTTQDPVGQDNKLKAEFSEIKVNRKSDDPVDYE